MKQTEGRGTGGRGMGGGGGARDEAGGRHRPWRNRLLAFSSVVSGEEMMVWKLVKTGGPSSPSRA